MFGEPRESNICIADLPAGANVSVVMLSGHYYKGLVVANYGGCIAIKESPEKIVVVENKSITQFEILGKESVDAFQITRAKSDASFKTMLKKWDEVSDK